jgi:hypothetical protein
MANMTPEERQRRMEERMKSMTPEERERWQARMREGGGRGGFQRGDGATGGGRGAAPGANATAARRPTAPSPAAASGAMTIDALFAPLPSVESRGRLWLYENKQLRSIAVRTGISDGQWTEILESGEGPALQPDTQVVTNVVTGLEPAPRPGQQNPGGSPLMPQRGGGPGGGGRGR